MCNPVTNAAVEPSVPSRVPPRPCYRHGEHCLGQETLALGNSVVELLVVDQVEGSAVLVDENSLPINVNVIIEIMECQRQFFL
jgi:hypothetical protein